jgi:RNA polymerase sigma-70 factor (ECF subfamily)
MEAMVDDDLRLIRKIQRSSDRAAADMLVRRYYDEIFRFVRKQSRDDEAALDVTQEAFIGALRTIGGYKSGISGFRTWLYKIAANKLVDAARSRCRHLTHETLTFDDVEPVDETDFVERVIDGELSDLIIEYLDSQPPDSQRVFRLRLFGEYSFAKIAVMLNLPESNVKSVYYRLIRRMRNELEKELSSDE